MKTEIALSPELIEEFAVYLEDFQNQTSTDDITLYCILQHICTLLHEEYGLRFLASEKVYMQ